jgi:hypothetical protein
MTSNRSDAAVSALLDDRIEVGGLRVISATDMLVFTCVHLARDAMHRDAVLSLKDLVLYKLVDIVTLMKYREFDDLPSRAERLGFSKDVYFGLHYCSEAFGSRVPMELLDQLRPNDLRYLTEVVDGDTVIHRWDNSAVPRIFDTQRIRELGQSRIPAVGAPVLDQADRAKFTAPGVRGTSRCSAVQPFIEKVHDSLDAREVFDADLIVPEG